jgi:SAM-dependent methyltransferase
MLDMNPVFLLAMGVVAVGVLVYRRVRAHAVGHQTPGGILIGDPTGYDTHSRILFGSLFRGIASDIAQAIAPGARVLEVGCGPGHLSVRLVRDHGLDVTGLDLDPKMVAHAQANAERSLGAPERPRFVVGDVASLPFDDGSFDVVVSTFSMHHWSDATAGLDEIARVVRPDGRVLIWDLGAGFRLFHADAPDPVAPVHGSHLRLVDVRPWRWPWRLTLSRRLELARR